MMAGQVEMSTEQAEAAKVTHLAAVVDDCRREETGAGSSLLTVHLNLCLTSCHVCFLVIFADDEESDGEDGASMESMVAAVMVVVG
jgi:hypothetical protein